jgi:multicomponent Na+:H+ antiporter subunit E
MNKSRLKSNHIFLFFFLLAFWLILSPTRDLAGIIIGIVISLFVTYINRNFVVAEKGKSVPILGNLVNIVSYTVTLVLEIIKSNIQVAKIVLSPSLPIEPHFVKVPVKMESDLLKVLYGNSITLTPGTLTVDITHDNYIVHALTKEAAQGLNDSIVEGKILKLEGIKK